MSEGKVVSSVFQKQPEASQEQFTTIKKVDINVLLNKIREEKKKKKIESTIFFSLIVTALVVTGIIISI